MKAINRNLISKLLIGFSIIMLIPVNSFPYLYFNGSGEGYGGGGESAGIRINENNTIEMYVVAGAGYFLNAHFSVQFLLRKVEVQDLKGMDYNEIQQLLNLALENITSAVETYQQLIEIAENTPYNPLAVDKLMAFDYEGYMKENGLNPFIFKTLAGYLSRGDITGTFKKAHSSMAEIKNLLVTIKNDVSFDRLPALPVFWQLNELCSETSIFGSYAARVFQTAL